VYDSEVGKVKTVEDTHSKNGGCVYDRLLRKKIGSPSGEEE
jgi:hypothetical protein